MDRKVLIKLLLEGMQYPAGKHRIWISRCFEISVHPNQMIELDEYEGYDAEDGSGRTQEARPGSQSLEKMFHVGRSILHLKKKQVIEKPGTGWQPSP